MLIIYYQLSFQTSGGDLTRIAKLSVAESYRDQFKEDFNAQIIFDDFSQIVQDENVATAKIFTVGDSFSMQDNYGYQNYLAQYEDNDIINFDFDRFDVPNYNPLQFLSQIANGDVLEELDVDYVILESVVREFVKINRSLNQDSSIHLNELKNEFFKEDIENHNSSRTFSNYVNDLKSHYFNSLAYKFQKKPFRSDVYKVETTGQLFSINTNDLLFYSRDIETIKNANLEHIKTLNSNLNTLSKTLNDKGIKLIVVASVDKYDLYSNYILENEFQPNPFFSLIDDLDKDYIFINTKNILQPLIESGVKDVFFYDDTHWSPKASRYVARVLNEAIN
jgi:hypothetical protein